MRAAGVYLFCPPSCRQRKSALWACTTPILCTAFQSRHPTLCLVASAAAAAAAAASTALTRNITLHRPATRLIALH